MKETGLAKLTQGTLRRAGAAGAVQPADEDIVRDVLGGNTDAFEHLIHRHQKPLINFLYRMLGNFDTAADMTQEVFTKAFLALERFDPRYRFTTWLYRIASNCAIDHLRRHRPPTISLDQPLWGGDTGPMLEVASRDASPVEEFEYQETARRLSRAIESLPPSYRNLIVLRHLHHMSYDQIATVSRLPIGTVKNRIFRARCMLKRRIGGDGSGDPGGDS